MPHTAMVPGINPPPPPEQRKCTRAHPWLVCQMLSIVPHGTNKTAAASRGRAGGCNRSEKAVQHRTLAAKRSCTLKHGELENGSCGTRWPYAQPTPARPDQPSLLFNFFGWRITTSSLQMMVLSGRYFVVFRAQRRERNRT